MSRRYFMETPVSGTTALLVGDEAKHLAKVLRAQVGDEVTLFAGDGLELTAQITAIGKSKIELSIVETLTISRESPTRLQLAVALPKGDRQRYLIEKCVELGVAKLVPLVAQRSVAQPVGKALERCQRYVIEASKQCGRNELLDISEPMTTVDFWKSAEGPMRFIAHPNEAFGTAESTTPDQTITVAIGPEGGFTAEEVQAAIELGWFGLCLGPRVLRVETAAMCAAARFCR